MRAQLQRDDRLQGSLALLGLTRSPRAPRALPVDVFHVLDIGTEGKISGAPRVDRRSSTRLPVTALVSLTHARATP